MSSTRIKDAGIAIRHSRGYTFFYTAGSGNGLEGVVGDGTLVNGLKTHLKKTHFSSFFASPGPRPGPGPRAQAQGLRRRMKNLKKDAAGHEKFEKILKTFGF